MPSAALDLIPYAIVAALSPLGFAATIAVMRTGRLRAVGFGLGVVFGQLVACSALIAVGTVITPDRTKAYPTFGGLLEIGFGVVLLCFAVAAHRQPETAGRSTSARTQAALDRLQRVRVVTASGVGFLLGIGGPKRLVLTALAAASITATGITGSNEARLVGWYTLLATVLVWSPVLAYLFFGDLVVGRLDETLVWLSGHRRPATVWVLVAIGIVLLVEGLLLL